MTGPFSGSHSLWALSFNFSPWACAGRARRTWRPRPAATPSQTRRTSWTTGIGRQTPKSVDRPASDWQTSCRADWQTNLSADWQTSPYMMDWQICISEWSGRLTRRGLADQLCSKVAALPFQRTGRQTREWTGRDLTPGRPAGRLSLWRTLENRFKKDFLGLKTPNTQRGQKYSRKKPVSPTAFVHVLNFYVFCIWPQPLVVCDGSVYKKEGGECVGCDQWQNVTFLFKYVLEIKLLFYIVKMHSQWLISGCLNITI